MFMDILYIYIYNEKRGGAGIEPCGSPSQRLHINTLLSVIVSLYLRLFLNFPDDHFHSFYTDL